MVVGRKEERPKGCDDTEAKDLGNVGAFAYCFASGLGTMDFAKN